VEAVDAYYMGKLEKAAWKWPAEEIGEWADRYER